MFNILMVCTGNICRSPMAEGLLRHALPPHLAKRVRVGSAGTHALLGYPAEDNAVKAMAQLGIDIGNHRGRQLSRSLLGKTDLILAMELRHLEIISRMQERSRSTARLITEFGDLPLEPDIRDPYGGPLEAYQACSQTLSPCIHGLVEWLDNEMGGI